MTITTLSFEAPIPASAWSEHPALRFYDIYGEAFTVTSDSNINPEKYYNAKCKVYLTDRSELEGPADLWAFFRALYSRFHQVEREILTVIVISDDEAGTHRIHAEVLTTLHPDHGMPVVLVPQTFVYLLGKADKGKGTLGLQFKELRCYYDNYLVDKALESIESP